MSDELVSKEPAHGRVSIDEPSTSKNDKKKNLQAGTFLRNKHPELFEIQPRRGGFRPHKTTHQDANHQTVDSDAIQPKISPSSTSKLRARDQASIREVLETNIRCPSVQISVSKDDRKNNMVRLCSTAISTVMMLAQQAYEDITMEHINHTEKYLRGLKRPSGYPANVGQLMQLLTNLKNSEKITHTVTEKEEEEENYRDEKENVENNKEEKEEEDHDEEMSDLIS